MNFQVPSITTFHVALPEYQENSILRSIIAQDLKIPTTISQKEYYTWLLEYLRSQSQRLQDFSEVVITGGASQKGVNLEELKPVLEFLTALNIKIRLEIPANLFSARYQQLSNDFSISQFILPVISFNQKTRKKLKLPEISPDFFSYFTDQVDQLSYGLVLLLDDPNKDYTALQNSLKYLLVDNKFQLMIFPGATLPKNVSGRISSAPAKQRLETSQHLKRIFNFFGLKQQSIYDFVHPEADYFDHTSYRLTEQYYGTDKQATSPLSKQVNFYLQSELIRNRCLNLYHFFQEFGFEFDAVLPGLLRQLHKKGWTDSYTDQQVSLTESGEINAHLFLPQVNCRDKDLKL